MAVIRLVIEVVMTVRASLVLLLLLSISPAIAKDKKQQVLPDVVLRAQTLVVVIHPDAGEPLTDTTANRTAQEDVEKAFAKWGRFKLQMDEQTADLIVAVRKGHATGPTIKNSPTDRRPVIYQGNGRDVRVGGQQGGTENRGPSLSNEIGPSEDTFEVYLGGMQDPLESSPIWRYSAKDALKGPRVSAIEKFQQAITESEKASQQKP
jgi:hypothetical protein